MHYIINIGMDEITIINPGVLQITKPTINEDYTMTCQDVTLGGTISLESTDPVTATIKINGKEISDYEKQNPFWNHQTSLFEGENLPAVVISAFFTNFMGKFRFLAVRTGDKAGQTDLVFGPAHTGL